jgi:protease-4
MRARERRLARTIVLLSCLLGISMGCGGKKQPGKDTGEARGENEPAAGQDDTGESPGSPLGNLDFLGSLLSRQLDEPGPYDEPRRSAGHGAGSDHHAVIELYGPVVELRSFSWLSMGSGVELSTLRHTLARLAADEHVKGVVLRAGDLSMSMATAEELRGLLVALKGAGQRSLHCHTESVSTITYYVLSACDSIGLAPAGGLAVYGVAAMPIHVKGLLEKLGLRPDFMHIGAYKGAAEPLTRDQPSNEMRQTIDAILDQAYRTLVAGIAQGRGLEPAAVQKLIDTAVFVDQEALAARLVDAVETYEAYRDRVLQGGEWTVVKVGKSDKPGVADLMRFVGLLPRSRPWREHVALVYAVGSVIDGKGEGVLGARQEIASRTLSAALRALAADDKVKAVVVRVDSGGGSALASELIWHAVAELREKKPVVVSMGSMAASGGYYIACGASEIFAVDNTLTGSIGVVGGKLAMRGSLDKLGVKAYPMGRGKRALIGSMVDAWSADERQAMRSMMESVYRTFVKRVAESRKRGLDQVETVAHGRVWTGAQAREHGLIDSIGGLDAAIARARELGGVAADVELEVYPPEPTLIDLLGSFGQAQASLGADATLAETVHGLARTLGLAEARAVASLLDQVRLLEQSRVLAVTFWPVVVR